MQINIILNPEKSKNIFEYTWRTERAAGACAGSDRD
jgi:hypothetical protein